MSKILQYKYLDADTVKAREDIEKFQGQLHRNLEAWKRADANAEKKIKTTRNLVVTLGIIQFILFPLFAVGLSAWVIYLLLTS